MEWNPALYTDLITHRERAALDLLHRVEIKNPRLILDAGCGTGNVTHIIKRRWPDANVTGLDYSKNMIDAARESNSSITWIADDLRTWSTDQKFDLIYSNATLQWIENNDEVILKLFSCLSNNGILAIQMPRPFIAKFYQAMIDTINELKFGALLNDKIRNITVKDPAHYLNLLESKCLHIDVWQTEYTHALKGDPHPVVLWTEATTLLPVKNNLPQDDWRKFIKLYTEKIFELYPMRNDKTAIFDLKRVFIVAQK